MPKNESINWEWLLEGYNRIKKTSHEFVTDMLTSLYAKEKTLIRTGDVLGVSSQTVCTKMHDLKIPLFPAGHRGKSKCIRAILALGDVSQMTAMQIAKAIDFSRSYVTVCLQQEGILYRRGRCQNNA
jgi:hypothetical protein